MADDGDHTGNVSGPDGSRVFELIPLIIVMQGYSADRGKAGEEVLKRDFSRGEIKRWLIRSC